MCKRHNLQPLLDPFILMAFFDFAEVFPIIKKFRLLQATFKQNICQSHTIKC